MMKTKLIFLTWLLLLPIAMMASSGEVVLQCGYIGDGWGGGAGGGTPIPRVTYDDTSITFSCDSIITQMDVVKDIQGNVLIEDTISLNHTYVLQHVPETLNHHRYLVELYFDNRYYYGYFDQ